MSFNYLSFNSIVKNCNFNKQVDIIQLTKGYCCIKDFDNLNDIDDSTFYVTWQARSFFDALQLKPDLQVQTVSSAKPSCNSGSSRCYVALLLWLTLHFLFVCLRFLICLFIFHHWSKLKFSLITISFSYWEFMFFLSFVHVDKN